MAWTHAHTRTRQADCSTWTTKLVGNDDSVVADVMRLIIIVGLVR